MTQAIVFCAISCPSKSGIRPHSDPQVVEARKRATALLLTVGMIVKETVTEREHFRKSNHSLLQVHDKFRYSDKLTVITIQLHKSLYNG